MTVVLAVTSGSVENATAHNGAIVGLPKTEKNDLSDIGAEGRRDGKNMTGQTFLKQNLEN